MEQLVLDLPTALAACQSLFKAADGTPITSSRAIAKRFGKKHKNVLQSIDKLLADIPDVEFGRLNFQPSSYLNEQQKQQPEYLLTHDGFALLAMGFTGPEALAWKIAFLQAFNALEAERHARTARYASALDALKPSLRPTVEGTEAGLNRMAIGARLGKSPAAVSYHRRAARRLGLLAA